MQIQMFAGFDCYIAKCTILDSKICHPSRYDFFLFSHAHNQGTSRPAHYFVLFDENYFSSDFIQLLTNSLCYTFAQCTKSIFVVPSVHCSSGCLPGSVLCGARSCG